MQRGTCKTTIDVILNVKSMIVLIIPYIQLNTWRSKCMFYQTGIAHKTHPDILSGELFFTL